MKRIAGVIILALLLISGCDDDDECPVPNSIIGYWNIESIIEDEVVVERSMPDDTVWISFVPTGLTWAKTYSNSYGGDYQLFDNDSIWLSPLGGTSANELNFGDAFKSILPNVTHLEFKTYKDLVLHTTDRKSLISLNKIE